MTANAKLRDVNLKQQANKILCLVNF